MLTHAEGWEGCCKIHMSKESTTTYPVFSLTEYIGKTIFAHSQAPPPTPSNPHLLSLSLSLSLSLTLQTTYSLSLYHLCPVTSSSPNSFKFPSYFISLSLSLCTSLACSFLPTKKIMATCGSLMSLFENPMPEKPTLIESLSSWSQTPRKQIEPASFTEIFGELHFHEKPEPPPTSPPPLTSPTSDQSPRFEISGFDQKKCGNGDNPSLDSLLMGATKDRYRGDPKNNGGFSPKNSESLQLCTEGLGSESSDDVDDMINEVVAIDDGRSDHAKEKGDGGNGYSRSCYDVRSRSGGRGFPPPISSIGGSGKPWVCFKSYREGGRFVLREIRIPTQEFLRASREDGRLKLHFVHPDVDMAEGEEEEEEEAEEQDEDEEEEQEQEMEGGEEEKRQIIEVQE